MPLPLLCFPARLYSIRHSIIGLLFENFYAVAMYYAVIMHRDRGLIREFLCSSYVVIIQH